MSNINELIFKSQAGDNTAKETLIEENSGLIWSVARRFMGRGVEPEDLYQLGCLGFVKAVDGFDLSFGTQFSTYAVPKISGEIRRYIRDNGSVKVSRSIKERAYTIKNTRNHLQQTLGHEPTIQEIANQTGLSLEEIAIAESATACVESIHQETGEGGFTLETILSDTESEESLLEKIALQQAINCLGQRDAMVVRLRYYHGLTQERIAKVLGVSQVQVSRIEKKVLIKLRELLQ